MRTIIFLCILSVLLVSCSDSTGPKYTVSAPTFSPAGGNYSSTQTVSIYCNVSNAQIRYTTDGSDPVSSSPLYSVPIQINSGTVLKARGYKNKMKPSAITSANYNFSVGTIYITPLGGTFDAIQEVTMITATPGTAIHYTTDGTEPTAESLLYTQALQLDGNVTIKAKGFIEGWTPSNTVTADFVFQPALPVLSYSSGVYYGQLSLSITSATAGAVIKYTTDNTEPTEASQTYTIPLNIKQSGTIKAKSFKTNWTPSATTTGSYTLKPVAPAFNPAPNTFNTPQKVTITCTTPGANIHYTTDGSEPSTSSALYATPVYLTLNTTLKAVAFITGWSPSNISSGNYSFVVASPVYNPPQGIYNDVQNVSITSTTADAQIRYTTDGTDPSPASQLYTAPITVSATTMLKARAYKTGMNVSPAVSALYQIVNVVSTPTFDPPAGIYYAAQEVSINCATSMAEIHFTIDGTEPNSSSPIYSSPLSISASTTVKAKAFRTGWTASATGTAAYSIESTDQISAWGNNEFNQCNVPIGNDFAQIDAGLAHSLGIRTDGSLVAWGNNSSSQCNFPAGNDYIAVSAGDNHSLALKADGTVVAWGANGDGQCDVPDSLGYTYIAISAGGNHSIAITSDSMLVAWGSNSDGQCDVPTGNNFVKVSAGEDHNIALRANHTIVAWGNNDSGQINAPTGTNYIDVSAGAQHCIAKRSTGTLIGWGNNQYQQSTCPVGTDFVQISAGYAHNLALRSNGTIVTWGYNGSGLADVPASSSFIAVSAGGEFSLGLKNADRKYGAPKMKLPKWKFNRK